MKLRRQTDNNNHHKAKNRHRAIRHLRRIMGEGILIYGLRNHKRRYFRDLQTFATSVAKRRKTNNSVYIFGIASRKFLRDLNRRGIKLHTRNVAITDKTIMKYMSHPKKQKGAVVSFHRWRMVETAVKHPKNVYIDTKRNRLVYICATKYSPNEVIKVVIEPNQKIGKHIYNQVTSVGVVQKNAMRHPQYKKIK